MTIDITSLSRVVRRLDVSATLRSFVVVLAPIFVLTNLAAMVAAVKMLWGEDFSLEEDWWVVLLVLGGVVLAFAPLLLFVADWVARKDEWRHLAALAGAALGALGFMMVGAFFVFGATIGEEEGLEELLKTGTHRAMVIGIGGALLLGFGTWLTTASRRLRALLLWAAVGMMVLGLAAFLVFVFKQIRKGEGDPADPRQIISSILALAGFAFSVWFLVRTVRLKILLSGEQPRSLLLGALVRKNFWVRFAFLAGLPSSLWNGRALRTGAFWALILSRPLVYVGFFLLASETGQLLGTMLCLTLGLLLIAGGHLTFSLGKRLAARKVWDIRDHTPGESPILFLRSFKDDQLDFKRPRWDLFGRWVDLWSFRRNADEALIDEIAQYGPVVALGQPGEKKIPFGAMRYYSNHEEWRAIITATARRARAIVIAAGDTPGVLWEYELLSKENLLDRTLLLFRPTANEDSSNRRALQAFLNTTATGLPQDVEGNGHLVALVQAGGVSTVLRANRPTVASYVIALRAHCQNCSVRDLSSAGL